jgi:hypothetical protein
MADQALDHDLGRAAPSCIRRGWRHGASPSPRV